MDAAVSLLSDELVRQLVAAGQVDVLVGAPSYNNAATIRHVARQVHVAFAKHFPRERTLLLNADRGSTDGTPDVVRMAAPDPSESIVTSQALRTIHRISVPFHGLRDKAAALRTILTAGDLLQARAVAVVDPAVTSLSPDWVHRLVTPVLRGEAEFVAPRYVRHPLEGTLVTQLARPLVRAAYGWRMQEPLAAEFACSGRFIRHVLESPVWEGEEIDEGVDLWLSLEALTGGFRVAEAPLGVRVSGATGWRAGIADVLAQIFRTLLGCLDEHAAYWTARNGSEPLPIAGADVPSLDGTHVAIPTQGLVEQFRVGVAELAPVLEQALPPEPWAELQAAAAQPGVPEVSDALWVRTVFEFVAADHRGTLPRGHLAQALVPLYLGRTASFLAHHEGRPGEETLAALESLALEYERHKNELVAQWQSVVGR